MSKISEYLGQNLSGEVTTETATRQYFSTDGGILKYTPQVVIYPRTADDIRKAARFAWRLAEKGYQLPITPRGYGSDDSGASLGSGIVMIFPAHMQKILELDTKVKKVRVQTGINVRTLEESLATHGLFLPTYPMNSKFATVGGIIANGVNGPKSLKYGGIRNWVDQLEIILASGEIIQTGRISKRELNAKKGLQTLEGEIYRELDGLIEDNRELIERNARTDIPDNTGYRLDMVKGSDGSFNLTPLIAGSQGTLAIISQAILSVAPKPVDTALMAVVLPSLDNFADLVDALVAYAPSELDYVDSETLGWVEEHTGVAPLNTLSEKGAQGVLFLEFDDGDGRHSKSARKVMKMLDEFGAIVEIAETQDDKEDIWAARYSTSAILNHRSPQGVQAVRFSGGTVPVNKLGDFMDGLRELIKARKLDGYISGHVGAGELSVTALADMNRVGDRQAVFGFMRDYAKLAGKLGGTMAGDSGDGRLGIAGAYGQYGDDMLGVYERVKQIFDPKGVFNPGVILDSTEEELIKQLNRDPVSRFLYYRPRV